MLASVPNSTDPARLPSTGELTLCAARLMIAANPGIVVRQPDRRPTTTIVVKAVINVARAARAVRRLRRDPATPSILAGAFYTDPDANRELDVMVNQLVHVLTGAAGLAWQEAGIDALGLAHRHACPHNQLVTAAHVLDLLGPPIR